MLRIGNNITVGKPIYKFHNNHSVEFDGIDDFIQLGEPLSYTQHTISTWVKVSDTGASKTIIDARDANDDGIRIFVTSAEVVTYQLNTSDINSGSAISVDEWHHIVATYDGTTQKLYIDGSLVDSTATSQTISTTTNAEIGARNFSDRANEFAGKIDELAIYDRALEQEEVEKIFRIKYGANLVQNGRFDELGSEIMTDGNFSEGLTHYTTNNVQVTNGVVSFDSSSDWIFQSHGSSFTTGKTYKVTTEGTGNLRFRYGFTGTAGTLRAFTVGTNLYFVADSDTNRIQFYGSASSSDATLSNISVKQVDPNDRFALGTGWAINDSGLVYTGTTNANAEQEDILTSGKVYKLTYNVVTSTIDGVVKLMSETVSGTVALQKSVGTHTQLITANGSNGTDFGIRITGNTTGTYIIDNLMIEQQKYVATNLKLNSIPYSSSGLKNYYRMGDGILDKFPLICDMVEPSLGSELVVNGNFRTDSDWDKSSNWTIANNLATSDGSQTGNVSLFQENSVNNFVTGKLYKVEFTISNYVGGVINPHVRGQASGNVAGNGLKTAYIIAGTSSAGINLYAGANFAGSISNVTAKQVNGVAGIMTNMSEADITNDVPS
tara:strand:+ start:328 stop:2145 length:1818 start_codon:yes stop_codon:yes gene_type:complete